MKSIRSYDDHPELQHEPTSTIYLLNNGFYWATPECLRSIWIVSFDYTNMGEPFRQLVRVNFEIQPKNEIASINISFGDAYRIIEYCKSTGYRIEISKELANNRSYQNTIEDIM